MSIKSDKLHLVSILSFYLITCGSILFLSYEWSIDLGASELPLAFLFIGVSMLAAGSAFLWVGVKRNHAMLFLISLYLLSLTLLLVNSFRFKVLVGSDNLWEYRAARDTLEMGRWPLERVEISGDYSSLATSILPAIFTEVTEIDLLLIFRFLFMIVGGIIPLLLFIVVRGIFDEKVASTASILFAQSEFFFSAIHTHIKMMVALIFLLLTLFLIFKNMRNKRKNPLLRILCLVFMFGIVFSHYYMVYFSIGIFLAFMLSYPIKLIPLSFMKIQSMTHPLIKRYFDSQMLFYFLVLAFSWFIFNVFSLFIKHVNLGRHVLLCLAGLGTSQLAVIEYNPLTFSPRGSIISAWFFFVIFLSFISIPYVWLRLKKDDKKILWILGGTTISLFFLIWTLTPGVTSFSSPFRILLVCNLFLYSFLSLMLVTFFKKSGSLRTLVFVFLSLNLAMNLRIPAHETMVLYHPQNSLPFIESIKERHNTETGFVLAGWIVNYVPSNEIISTDARVYDELYFTKNIIITVQIPEFARYLNSISMFLVIPHYYAKNSLWVTRPSPTIDIVSEINYTLNYDTVNIIYSSGYHTVVTRY